MRILVTGSDGYIGSVATHALIGDGHEVLGVDSGLYFNGLLYPKSLVPQTVRRDTRDLTARDLDGFDAVVAMADLSNDPTGDLLTPATYAINYDAIVRLAQLAREAGVSRFIYMSSCAVYGASDGVVNEDSPLSPLTTYAKCKALVESELMPLAADDFHPVALRNATAFGASPMMRFDLVVNNLAASAWTNGEVRLHTAGTQWRPLVHVLDITQAIRLVLNAEPQRIHRKIYNVGSNSLNLQVADIADAVSTAFSNCPVRLGTENFDFRSYKVRFDRIRHELGFETQYSLGRGLDELKRLFQRVALNKISTDGPTGVRLEQLKHLLATNQVDDLLRWKKNY